MDTPPAATSVRDRLRRLTDRFPRLVRALPLVGLVLVGLSVFQAKAPTEVTFVYDLGAAHGAYEVLRLAYVPYGQSTARAITRRFPGGAPRTFEHAVTLPRGVYDVRARLEGPGGVDDVVVRVELARQDRVPVLLERRSPFSR